MGRDRPQLRSVALDLTSLDRLAVEALAAGVFPEQRPLRGALGWCDWRLGGRLSRMVQGGALVGERGETLLTDTAGLLPFPRVLLFGLGPRAEFDLAGFRSAVRQMLVVARRALVLELALELPGVEPGPIDPQQAIGALVEVSLKSFEGGAITLLCPERRFGELAAEIAGRDNRVRWLADAG